MTRATARPVLTGAFLSVAHHPLCTRFRHDVVRLGGLPVCAGCLATWPAFLVALPLALEARLGGAEAGALLATGVALALPQMTAYLRRARPSRPERAAAQVLGGTGLAVALAAVATSGWPLGLALAAIAVGVLATGILQAVRFRALLAACDACPYRRDWDACPGFAGAGSRPLLPDAPVSLLDG